MQPQLMSVFVVLTKYEEAQDQTQLISFMYNCIVFLTFMLTSFAHYIYRMRTVR